MSSVIKSYKEFQKARNNSLSMISGRKTNIVKNENEMNVDRRGEMNRNYVDKVKVILFGKENSPEK